MAQLVERRLGKAEVTGPIPVSSSLKKELMLLHQLFFCLRKSKENGKPLRCLPLT